MNLLEAKRITPSVWRDRMADLLARYHIAALMVGAGETAVPPAGVAILARNLTNQYGYLDNFATEVAAAEAFRNAWRARAQMYTQSAGASFWDGEIYRQAGRFLPLPAVPKDGTTQCMCITTPHSLVSTMRGDIPIVDVVPGDMVLTHRMRWRRVLKTFVNRSMPTHQQAWIITPDGRKIGCTTEHKWYTPNGWKTAISIHNSRDAMYNVPHEHMQEMRRGNGKSVQEGSVQILPSSMRVWEQERSQGNELQVVWDEEFSAYAMGFFGWAEKEDEGAERGGGYTAENEGGRSEWRGPELGEKGGRPLFHVLLGRGAPALHLPLPSGMDTRLRGDTQRHGHTPYRRGSGERRFEQPATYDPERSQFLSHGRGTKARNGGREGERVRDKAGVGLPDLRGDIREIPESWQSATEILLGDMLPEGTALYDLQVEEDHSFIVDGIVTHNSNCKCSLRVEVVDAVANDFDVYWVMHPAEHCQTCIERAAQWNPLQIRDGMLMETAVKHLAGQHDQMTHGGGGPRAFEQTVYHGSGSAFSSFSTEQHGKNTDAGRMGVGAYFTTDKRIARSYALMAIGPSPAVYTARVHLSRPLTMAGDVHKATESAARRLGVKELPVWDGYKQTSLSFAQEFTDRAIRAGYDGAIWMKKGKPREIVAYYPTSQVSGLETETVKHLAGQHDQMTHGGSGSLGRFENWAAENMTSSQISHVRNGLSAMTDKQRDQ